MLPRASPTYASGDLAQRPGDVLAQRQQVSQDLGRMIVVGQAVVDRHAGPARERLGVVLVEAAELDGVVDAAEDPRGVLDGLLLADVAAARTEVRDVRALVVGGHLEADPRPGRVLLEDQRDGPPGEAPDLAVLALLRLEARREVEQALDLGRREVAKRQERSTEEVDPEVDSHCRDLLGGHGADANRPGAPCRRPGHASIVARVGAACHGPAGPSGPGRSACCSGAGGISRGWTEGSGPPERPPGRTPAPPAHRSGRPVGTSASAP